MIPNRFFILGLLLTAPVAVASADVNRVVLQVNDHIVTLHDYQMRYGERLRALQAAQIPEAERAARLAELGEGVFREMFDELLMLSKASHDRIEVTEGMVDAAVDRLREANGLEDAEEFDAALTASGMTRPMLRNQARRNLLLRQATAIELQSRVDLDEEDLRRYYQSHLEEFQVARQLQLRSLVVLETSGLEEDERAALAEEARAMMRSGADEFDAWAAAKSEVGETTDPINLGWIRAGDLDPDIESEVWDLEAGAVSAPVPARGGLHVVQVLGVEEAHLRPFAEVKDEVENLELNRLQQEAVTRMLTDLEKSSYIRIDPPPEAAGFRTSRAPIDEPLGPFPATEEPAAPAADDGR